ncbi:AMP-binding protein [Nonomuraea antimicrobica]
MYRTSRPADAWPSTSASGHCHARRTRLPGGGDAVLMARILEAASLAWWGEPLRLWTERVPAPAGSATANRRLDAELFRPVAAGGAGLRAVLLGYADGAADLVLVAHRARLDAASLRMVADVLTERAPYERFRPEEPGRVVVDDEAVKRWREADYSGVVEWAAGDSGAGDRTGVVTVALGGSAPEDGSADVVAKVAVAAGLVLGRYEGRPRPVVAGLTGVPGRPAGALGVFEAGVLLALDLSGASTVAELVAESARIIGGDGGWCDARRYADLCAEAGGRVLVGLLAGELDGPAGDRVPCQTAPFPLTLVPGRAEDGGLLLDVRHRLADVDEESARRFARHLARAYERLTDAGDDLVPGDVELLDEPERRHVIGLGRPARPLSPRGERTDRRIEDVFAARVADRPEAVALVGEHHSLTYAELDERATRGAAALRAAGVRPGERVGVCLERSPDLVVTMLAVLKAGAAYVPMDPAYPADRLTFTARDAALRVVVADGKFPAATG